VYTAHMHLGILSGMITEALQQAMADSGISRYRIAKDTELHATVLWRIAHGKSCSLETADKLAKYLGLELRSKKRRRR